MKDEKRRETISYRFSSPSPISRLISHVWSRFHHVMRPSDQSDERMSFVELSLEKPPVDEPLVELPLVDEPFVESIDWNAWLTAEASPPPP